MQIICHKTFQFNEATYSQIDDGRSVRKIDQSIIVRPSMLPQYAPDWIANDPTFAVAQKSGDLIQISIVTAPDAPALSEPTEPEAKLTQTNPVPSKPIGWGSPAEPTIGFKTKE